MARWSRHSLLLACALTLGGCVAPLQEVVQPVLPGTHVEQWNGLAAFTCCQSGEYVYPPPPRTFVAVDHDGRVLVVTYVVREGPLSFVEAEDARWKSVLDLALAEVPDMKAGDEGIEVQAARGWAMDPVEGAAAVGVLRAAAANANDPQDRAAGEVFDAGKYYIWNQGKGLAWHHGNDNDPGWERMQEQMWAIRAWADAQAS